MRKASSVIELLARMVMLALLCLLAVAVWSAIRIEKSIQNDADEAHRVLLEAGLTAREAKDASTEEKAYLSKELPQITAKTERALDDTDALLVSLRRTSGDLAGTARSATGVLDATRESVAGIAPILNQTRETIAGLEPVESAAAVMLKDGDALVKDPDISASLTNVRKGTAELAATSKDVREEVHAMTHPKPLVTAINWLLKIGGALGGWF